MTPTDDLRARHVEVLREFIRRNDADLFPSERAALNAALSALPAASNPVGYVRKDGGVEWYVDGGFSRIPAPGTDLFTTPAPVAASGEACEHEWMSGDNKYVSNTLICQRCYEIAPATPPPAAVSFDPASIGPFAAAAAMMEPAAVGAQGEGGSQFGPVTDAELGEPDPIPRNLLAAPAAGKGVDDAVDAARWRALIGSARVRVLGSAGLHSETDPCGKPHDDYAHIGLELWTKHPAGSEPTAIADLIRYADAARGIPFAERGKQAALTRQPVAGDGWRPIESAPKDGTRFIALVGSRAVTVAAGRHYEKLPSDAGGPTFRNVWHEIREDGVVACAPKGWMPLPAGPQPRRLIAKRRRLE